MKRFPIGNPIRASHERGGILVIAIIVILAMLIMAIPFLFKLSAQWRTTEKGSHSLAAFNLAEAGVERTMYYLDPDSPVMSDPENIIWTFEGSNQVGVINNIKSANATIMGNVNLLLGPPYGTTPPRRNLDSTGTVPFIADRPVNRSVRVNLEQFYKSIFDVGFFVDEYFYVRNSFFLDAYNSKDGAYGAPLAGGGTNSLLPDVYFGSNSYISDTNPKNPGDATWTIESGGGSSEVHGTIMAGGDAAEAFKNGTALNPPDPSLIGDVISVPTDDIFQGTEDRLVMNQDYELPPVDVFNLPPKDILGTIPDVGEWFEGYEVADPDSASYYTERLNRAPLTGEIKNNYEKGAFSGTGSLTPANSGFYTSFTVGTKPTGKQSTGTSGTLTISGGDVVIYVSSYGNAADPASFYMGPTSRINIEEGSSLTLILGNASMSIEQGYQLNATGNPPQAADLVILGTNQFALPPNAQMNKVDGLKKAIDADKMKQPGLVYLEHAQGGQNGTIYSAAYLPNAHLTGTGQGGNHLDFYGALLSGSMDFKNIVDFHYDKSLADLKIINGGFEFWKISNWAEVVGVN